jgi:hypothetical protein
VRQRPQLWFCWAPLFSAWLSFFPLRGCEMKFTLTMLLIAFTALSACVSPEATRTRGGGPGADLGNRTKVLEMHEGSLPFWKTPQIITTKHAPIETADQAYQLSRR